MNAFFKILSGQLELNDSLDSYDYQSFVKPKVLQDEKGKYQIKQISEERPCSCHPETCCHFDGKVWRTTTKKIYLNNQKNGN